MKSKHLVFAAFAFAFACTLAVTAQESATTQTEQSKVCIRKQPAQKQEQGEHVFQQHCSRCHTAPDGFSPRIAGTVVLHMRVRASLSQHEEEMLLRFFNP
jgi:cytochrome c5